MIPEGEIVVKTNLKILLSREGITAHDLSKYSGIKIQAFNSLPRMLSANFANAASFEAAISRITQQRCADRGPRFAAFLADGP